MKTDPLIAVASRSFSSNAELRAQLLEAFDNCRFNDAGLRLSGDSLAEVLDGAAGAIVGVEPIDGPLLIRLPHLRVLSKFGVGLDSIDVNELSRRNIVLAASPGTNSQAVAELALLLSMAALRRLPEALENTRTEQWSTVTGRLLAGKTVGLIGVGHVGRAFIELLRPFKCRVLGFDMAPDRTTDVSYVTLPELLSLSDVVSVHLPLTAATQGFLGADQIALMKDRSVLINTSRGSVIDEGALCAALKAGGISAAGLDVLEHEPPDSWELARLSNVVLTPHIASSTVATRLAMAHLAADNLIGYLTEGQARTPLNPEVIGASR